MIQSPPTIHQAPPLYQAGITLRRRKSHSFLILEAGNVCNKIICQVLHEFCDGIKGVNDADATIQVCMSVLHIIHLLHSVLNTNFKRGLGLNTTMNILSLRGFDRIQGTSNYEVQPINLQTRHQYCTTKINVIPSFERELASTDSIQLHLLLNC